MAHPVGIKQPRKKPGDACPYCHKPLSEEHFNRRQKTKSLRIKEARRIAKERGDPCGRPRVYDRRKTIEFRKSGLTLRAIAKQMNCSFTTVYRILKQSRKQLGEEK